MKPRRNAHIFRTVGPDRNMKQVINTQIPHVIEEDDEEPPEVDVMVYLDPLDGFVNGPWFKPVMTLICVGAFLHYFYITILDFSERHVVEGCFLLEITIEDFLNFNFILTVFFFIMAAVVLIKI